jgi:tetratricopeptide (TPR) repeat protein
MRGRPDLALQWYIRSATRDQRRGTNSGGLGECFADLSEDGAAEEAFLEYTKFYPDRPEGYVGLARLFMVQGDFEKARRKCREAISMCPQDVSPARALADIEFFGRNFDQAQKLLVNLIESGRIKDSLGDSPISERAKLGFLQLQSGKISEGKRLLENDVNNETQSLAEGPHERQKLYDLASIYAGLGDRDRTIVTLASAKLNGWIDYRLLNRDPRFDSVRNDIRFQSLVAEMRQHVEELRSSPAVAEAVRNETNKKEKL